MAADTTPSPGPFVPGGKPEAVSIGINSVEWRGATLEQVLQSMQPFGLTLVELIARRNLRKEAVPQAKELLARHGVRVNSVSGFTKLNEVVHNGVTETQELINESLEIAAMMGAPFSHTYFGANAFLNDDEAIQRYVEFIKPCLRKAEETGVTLLVDNLFDSVPEEIPATFRQHYRSSDVTRSVKGCQQLLESVNSPWFQYNYDPGNFRCSAEEPYPYAYDVLKDFIRSVHLKDAVKYDRELHGDRSDLYLQRDLTGDYMCVALGAGAVNYDAVLNRLKADGYQGALILEPHTGERRLGAAIRDSLAYLASHGFVGKGQGAE